MAARHQARKGTATGAAGRFGAAARGPGAARTRRSTTVTVRSRGRSRGRKAQRGGEGGVMHLLGGLLGGAGTSAARSRGGGRGAKAGAGVAMLTAAAGLAFKNREKLGGLLRRDSAEDTPPRREPGPPAGTTGSNVHVSPAVTPGAGADMATPLPDPALGGVVGDRVGEPLDPPIGDPRLDRLGEPINAPDMPPVGGEQPRREEDAPPRDG